MTKKRVLLAFLLAVCGAGLYPHARSWAESKTSNPQESMAGIPFNDPAHAIFFKYQSYLTQHNKGGDTLETWQDLPGPDRAKKLADGEALLKKLHTDLLAKDKLSAEETELLQAVWGKSDVAGDRGAAHQSVVAREKSISVQKVSAVSKNLESFQKKNNWNQLFDGGQNSSKDPGTVDAAGGGAKRGATSLEPSPKDMTMRPLDEAKVPPIGNDNNGPTKRTLPFAAGAVLLGVGAALGVKKILGARNAELVSSESDGPRAEKSSSKTKLVRQAAFDHNAIAGIFGVAGNAATSCTCTGSSSEGCNCSGTTAKRACNCANDSSTFCDCSGGSSVVCDCNSSSSKLCTCSSGSSTTCDCSGSSAKVDVPCNCSSSSTK
jgi:hypothetical protein